MLTEIFADRYSTRTIWSSFSPMDSKLLAQCFHLISVDLFPASSSIRNHPNKEFLKIQLSNLARELGVLELTEKPYSTYFSSDDKYLNIAKDYMCESSAGCPDYDRFMKDRISLVEMCFRAKSIEVEGELHDAQDELNAYRDSPHARHLVSESQFRLDNANQVKVNFNQNVDEFNERLRRAGTGLNYHNGVLQLTGDERTTEEIERPFWSLVEAPLWVNVEHEMQQALDLRDKQVGDPVFYSGKALESTMKIIASQSGWKDGREKGAADFVDRLADNGYIEDWERKLIKVYFREVRNPVGHGAGEEPKMQLTSAQENWLIEFCMTTIKSLITRFAV